MNAASRRLARMSEAQEFNTLLRLMAELRNARSGCPWVLQQDFASVAPFTIEEAYEVADAIGKEDLGALKDELGDLLFQVVFHAQLASEKNAFDIGDVARSICAKLIKRNPHVFGGAAPRTATEQKAAWEDIKEKDRAADGARSLMDGIPAGLPELQRSVKLQRRAARAGFDWDAPGPVVDKLREESAELVEAMTTGTRSEIEEELGDLLFAVTNLARHLRVDPAAALRGANAKFEKRFRDMEMAAGSSEQLKARDLEEMEALWQQVKRSSKQEKSRE